MEFLKYFSESFKNGNLSNLSYDKLIATYKQDFNKTSFNVNGLDQKFFGPFVNEVLEPIDNSGKWRLRSVTSNEIKQGYKNALTAGTNGAIVQKNWDKKEQAFKDAKNEKISFVRAIMLNGNLPEKVFADETKKYYKALKLLNEVSVTKKTAESEVFVLPLKSNKQEIGYLKFDEDEHAKLVVSSLIDRFSAEVDEKIRKTNDRVKNDKAKISPQSKYSIVLLATMLTLREMGANNEKDLKAIYGAVAPFLCLSLDEIPKERCRGWRSVAVAMAEERLEELNSVLPEGEKYNSANVQYYFHDLLLNREVNKKISEDRFEEFHACYSLQDGANKVFSFVSDFGTTRYVAPDNMLTNNIEKASEALLLKTEDSLPKVLDGFRFIQDVAFGDNPVDTTEELIEAMSTNLLLISQLEGKMDKENVNRLTEMFSTVLIQALTSLTPVGEKTLAGREGEFESALDRYNKLKIADPIVPIILEPAEDEASESVEEDQLEANLESEIENAAANPAQVAIVAAPTQSQIQLAKLWTNAIKTVKSQIDFEIKNIQKLTSEKSETKTYGSLMVATGNYKSQKAEFPEVAKRTFDAMGRCVPWKQVKDKTYEDLFGLTEENKNLNVPKEIFEQLSSRMKELSDELLTKEKQDEEIERVGLDKDSIKQTVHSCFVEKFPSLYVSEVSASQPDDLSDDPISAH